MSANVSFLNPSSILISERSCRLQGMVNGWFELRNQLHEIKEVRDNVYIEVFAFTILKTDTTHFTYTHPLNRYPEINRK